MRRAVLALSFAACSGGFLPGGGGGGGGDADPEGDPTPDPEDFAYLSPTDHLVRVSMALRGMRPSLDDLELVRTDPEAIESLVETYLDSPQFGTTIRDLHAEAYLTRGFMLPAVEDLDPFDTGLIASSLGDEPLRLIEHVVMDDRPYSEIVTAEYTMANRIVATAYGLSYDAAGPDWQVTEYTDGRLQAGVLTQNVFYLRFRSAGDNWHRGRANQFSKALLCYDFLARDVVIGESVDLSDSSAVRDAVRDDAACASCHQTLDPLASFFWGFVPAYNMNNIDETGYPLVNFYRPGQRGGWMNTSGRPPGYFGQDGTDLHDLADLIVSDPRFTLCAAKRFHGYLTQTPLDEVPLEEAARLQEIFEASSLSAKALAKAVVMSDTFRRSHGGTEAAQAIAHGYQKVRPEQLDRMVRDLTGFTWETEIPFNIQNGPLGRVNLLTSSVLGYLSMAGGIDTFYVQSPTFGYNVTSALVLDQLAQEAAGFAVERDLAQADASERRLLTRVDASDTAEDAVKEQLADLHARLYARFVEPGSEEVAAAYELWRATYERTDDATHAWKTTLTAMLQDVRLAFY
jgi:hypothetical protein